MESPQIEISALLKSKGVRQAAIAKVIGLSSAAVNRVIKGNRRSKRIEAAVAFVVGKPLSHVFSPYPYKNEISALLKSKGVRQADIARVLGLSNAAVNHVIKGNFRSKRIEAAVAFIVGKPLSHMFTPYPYRGTCIKGLDKLRIDIKKTMIDLHLDGRGPKKILILPRLEAKMGKKIHRNSFYMSLSGHRNGNTSSKILEGLREVLEAWPHDV